MSRSPILRSKSLAFACIVAWLAFLLFVAWFRQEATLINTFDTGIYLQVLYNLAHHGTLASSLTNEANFFAHHFQPLMLLLIPFVAGHWQPIGLLLTAALAIAGAACFWWQHYAARDNENEGDRLCFLWLLLLIPSLHHRVFYSFTPEILVLPSLLYLTWRLSAIDAPKFDLGILVNLVVLGFGKENYWLTALAFALAFAVRQKRRSVASMLAAGLCLGIFLGLFSWWMPTHRSDSHYYGLAFYPYLNQPWPDFARQAIATLFSPSSLNTLARMLICNGLGLALFGLRWLWIPLLPGLLQILLSPAPQLHHQANHYGILVDPILWQAAWLGWAKVRSHAKVQQNRRMILAALIIVPVGFGQILDQKAPLFYLQNIFAADNALWHRRTELRQKLIFDPTRPIIAEDFLPPIFPEWQNVRVLLGYPGVAAPPDAKTLAEAETIVTQIDFSTVSCATLVNELAQVLPQVDQTAFLALCQEVKEHFKPMVFFAGLKVYRR